MPHSQKYPVLFVEDNINDQLLVEWAINKAQFPLSLNIVGDGEEAVRYLQGDGVYADRKHYPFPVLILSNMKMPRMNGLELLTWIKAQPKFQNLPVVVMSSSGDPKEEGQFKSLGSSAYFVKPVSTDALIEALKMIMAYLPSLNG